jgi:hypothetical protein
MKTLCIILLAGIAILGAACARQMNEGVVIKEDQGFLRLIGSVDQREVYIQGNLIQLDPNLSEQRLALKAGGYSMEIRSAGKLLLALELFISSGQTVEVSIP